MRKDARRRTSLTVLAVGLAVAAATPITQADVYKWVDAQGRVHYTDRPVPGAERVSTTTRLPASDAAVAAAAAEREKLKATQTQVQAQQAQVTTQQAVQQDVASARAEQCRAAREKYDRAVRARRMFRTNANGEREWLSDTAANAERVTAKTELDQACGPT